MEERVIGLVVMVGGPAGANIVSTLYHKICGKSVLERTVSAASRVSQSHRTIVVAPTSERKKISDLLYGHPGAFDRQILSYYYDEAENIIDVLQKVSSDNGLTTLVKINANDCLIPSWLINNCIRDYVKRSDNLYYCNCSGFDSTGIRVEVYPHWLICELYSNLIDGERQEYWKVIPENAISTADIYPGMNIMGLDLAFKSLEQHEFFEHFVLGLDSHDLEDMITEVANVSE